MSGIYTLCQTVTQIATNMILDPEAWHVAEKLHTSVSKSPIYIYLISFGKYFTFTKKYWIRYRNGCRHLSFSYFHTQRLNVECGSRRKKGV